MSEKPFRDLEHKINPEKQAQIRRGVINEVSAMEVEDTGPVTHFHMTDPDAQLNNLYNRLSVMLEDCEDQYSECERVRKEAIDRSKKFKLITLALKEFIKPIKDELNSPQQDSFDPNKIYSKTKKHATKKEK